MKKPGQASVVELQLRLAEAEETLLAIRTGEVDALVVAGLHGDRVFTLEGAGDCYRILIESMNEGALTLASDETILYANSRFAVMVGCTLERVIGGSLRRFISRDNWASLQALLVAAGADGTKIQVTLRTEEGMEVPAQLSLRALAGNGSDRATIGIVVTDLTDARRMAAQKETERLYVHAREQAAELERRVVDRTRQLIDANQELEAFEASVSHDLRAPLRNILGFADVLLEDFAVLLPATAQDYLRRIRDRAGKMEELIAALLEFSRMSKRSLCLQSVDIGRMCREVVSDLTPEECRGRIDVSVAELPRCTADPTLLRQVLINLIGNALKYSRTQPRSVIAISAAEPDGPGFPVYSIKDNGVGFNMVHADRLFKVFERLHEAQDFEGNGVGLTTAHRIIQRHGGRIWAESSTGNGATFFFTVRAPDPPSVVPPAAA